MYAMLGLGGFAISFALPKSHRQTCMAHSRRSDQRMSSRSVGTSGRHSRSNRTYSAQPDRRLRPSPAAPPTSGSMRPYSVLNFVLERLRAGQCLMCLRIDQDVVRLDVAVHHTESF